MGFRLKIGRSFSIGRTGPRIHLGTRNLSASAGASGGRLFGRLGPLYFNGRTKGSK